MNKENQDFCAGVLVGIIISCATLALFGVIRWSVENNGYENKLVIRYHSPNKEYDREMVQNMVNDSQVWTNFVVKEMKMRRYGIEYIMTNPKGSNH